MVRRNEVKGNLDQKKGNLDEADVGGEQAEILNALLNEECYSAAELSSRQSKWRS